MYHRFNESDYPSTNIQMNIFKKQIDIIKKSNYNFNNPSEFEKKFNIPKLEKEILITIDDAFLSFYLEAWPYLKKNKIPFILFVSTEPVGKRGYMTWDQIREVEAEDFAFIGHHSHTHDYLIDKTSDQFVSDIKRANEIFLKELGYIPNSFSYPFGEYSKFMRDYVSQNFKFAFGQHSGVIDINKDKFELPRFPINEKYGELKRFTSLTKTLPFKYEKIIPEEKFLIDAKNPPDVKIKFFENIENLKLLNCYSNEGGNWRKSKINFSDINTLEIFISEKFIGERGRINCSLRDQSGFWRWLGIQFVVSNK